MISFNNNDRFLVTGASSGLGRAISHKLIELGASVVGIARNEERLIQTKEQASDPTRFDYEIKDISQDQDSIPKWLKVISEKYSSFKGMALSAGVQHTLPIQAEKTSKSRELFETNFFANHAMIKAFSNKSCNAGNGSSIVVISSFTSELGVAATGSYSASKGALNSLVKTAAVEFARSGLRINSVMPGHVVTEMLEKGSSAISEKFIESLKEKYPLGLGQPDDVANMVCFLLSDSARWVTGSKFVIDGGASIQF